jgi:hypothetical protein
MRHEMEQENRAAPRRTSLARAAFARGGAALAAVALCLCPGAARAAVSFETDGWTVSFDGFVNAFGANQMGSSVPVGVVPDPLMTTDDLDTFRVRTGLLPGLFAFNVQAPRTEGLDVKARVGLYPQINNDNTRNAFGSQIDLREIFFTVDGRFGQVLVGRALNLYQGKNILTDMSLFGVGAQGPASAGGTTLGRIGYGYLYTQFGAQLRYTTPELAGLKLAVGVVDPSQIAGGGVTATRTDSPGVEAELAYARKLGAASVQGWVSALSQDAAVPGGDTKTAQGWAAGAGVGFHGVELLASGFGGKALGTFLLLDTDSLDADGAERRSLGFLGQAAYTYGKTKVGLSYGQTTSDETAGEAATRLAGGPAVLDARRSWTGGVYHDVNKHLKVVAEYTRATSEWVAGQRQSVDVVALGGFFMW